MAQADVGQIKCKVDATIFKDQNCFSIGMCLCGDKGESLAVKMAWFKGVRTTTSSGGSLRLRRDHKMT